MKMIKMTKWKQGEAKRVTEAAGSLPVPALQLIPCNGVSSVRRDPRYPALVNVTHPKHFKISKEASVRPAQDSCVGYESLKIS